MYLGGTLRRAQPGAEDEGDLLGAPEHQGGQIAHKLNRDARRPVTTSPNSARPDSVVWICPERRELVAAA